MIIYIYVKCSFSHTIRSHKVKYSSWESLKELRVLLNVFFFYVVSWAFCCGFFGKKVIFLFSFLNWYFLVSSKGWLCWAVICEFSKVQLKKFLDISDSFFSQLLNHFLAWERPTKQDAGSFWLQTCVWCYPLISMKDCNDSLPDFSEVPVYKPFLHL